MCSKSTVYQARPASCPPCSSTCQAIQPTLTTSQPGPDGPAHGRRPEARALDPSASSNYGPAAAPEQLPVARKDRKSGEGLELLLKNLCVSAPLWFGP
ncbi:MAG: hypothetical protein JW999_05980 [Methanotrichaceae archaeon]|nr:hypothetical protein [Methanotrichaceae archaeon]